MQFKHPEILYVLFALLIPIFIHLFQLQRFTKTLFTNVKFLKEIALQTRKSSRLKKWLVLCSRLLAFSAIIIAFAQPYTAKNSANHKWSTSIYLDNSWSMKAKGAQGELLKRAIQDLAENIPDNGNYNLLTNDETLTNLTKNQFIEAVKKVSYSSRQINLQTLLLRLDQLEPQTKETTYSTLLISDFQDSKKSTDLSNAHFSYIQTLPSNRHNISIDSITTSDTNSGNRNMNIHLINQGIEQKNSSITALSKDMILAKTSFDIDRDSQKTIQLSVPKNRTSITVKIDVEDSYLYDNTFYISFSKAAKIPILVIGDQQKSFLDRIYKDDEFDLHKTSTKQIAYNSIDKQQLIILFDNNKITKSLLHQLLEFVKKGGSLVVVPTKKSSKESIQLLYNSFTIGQVNTVESDSLQITKIHYAHPILKHVFERKITNFQYPNIAHYYDLNVPVEQPILSYENNKSFVSAKLIGKGKIYWFSAPLDANSGNFIDSPLIVPIFYNMGKQSQIQSQLSYSLGKKNTIVVRQKLPAESVLHVKNTQIDFIPYQEILSDKVILHTDEQPNIPGFYAIQDKEVTLQNIAFNIPKSESSIHYINLDKLTESNAAIHHFKSIKQAMQQLSSEQNIHSIFKWFVLLALLFLCIEILLLKFL